MISNMARYRWPGNVRELENVIERMVVLAVGDQITDADLPDEIRAAPPVRNSFLELPDDGISLEAVERPDTSTSAAAHLSIASRSTALAAKA